MPTYQYRCTECEHEFEIVQKFSDAALTSCPQCDGTLRKVFSPVGVVFKGSGFYATDNRTKGKANAAAPSDAKSEASSTESAAPASATTGTASAPSSPAPTPAAGSGSAPKTTSAPAASA